MSGAAGTLAHVLEHPSTRAVVRRNLAALMAATAGADAVIDQIAARRFWNALRATSPGAIEAIRATTVRGNTPSGGPWTVLTGLLTFVHSGIGLSIGGDPLRPDVVITAYGVPELFPIVLALVDAAPQAIHGTFQVHAGRPRVADPAFLSVRLGDATIPAGDLRYSASQHPAGSTRCDVVLYVPGYDRDADPFGERNGDLTARMLLALDHLLGEYNTETQIGMIEWEPADAAADDPDARPLTSLPDYLDTLAAGHSTGE